MYDKEGFAVGDRVILLVDHPSGNRHLTAGMHGTVCDISGVGIGVEWDEEVSQHDCGGMCRMNHGWWVSPREIDNLTECMDGRQIQPPFNCFTDDELIGLISEL